MPISPLLFAAFPVISLFAHNFDQLNLGDLWRPLVLSIAFGFTVWSVINFIFEDRKKSAIVVVLLLLAFYSYTPITSALQFLQINKVFVAYLFVFLGATYLTTSFFKQRKFITKATQILNIVTIALLVYPIISIAQKQIQRNKIDLAWGQNDFSQTTAPSNKELPDIYYIIVDRYVGNNILKSKYNFDNSDFINFLKNKGFYVTEQSNANYPFTVPSVASSLNMEYLNILTDQVGRYTSDEEPLAQITRENKIVKFLKGKGYTYYHFGPWHYLGEKNPYADYNYEHNATGELGLTYFEDIMLSQTLLKPLLSQFSVDFEGATPLSDRWSIYRDTTRMLSEVSKTGYYQSPKFVFVHSMATHPPMVFNKDGSYKPATVEKTLSREENYTDQLIFANKQLKGVIESILELSPTPPIIILQSDEGTYPARISELGNEFLWTNATEDELKEKFSILNAYYLPGKDANKILYPSVTPVNSFRIIFNEYFDEQLPLLEDRHYVREKRNQPYNYVEVTESLKLDRD